jgi:hypothetical protein
MRLAALAACPSQLASLPSNLVFSEMTTRVEEDYDVDDFIAPKGWKNEKNRRPGCTEE